jgi:hypothetical protein
LDKRQSPKCWLPALSDGVRSIRKLALGLNRLAFPGCHREVADNQAFFKLLFDRDAQLGMSRLLQPP